MALVVTPPGRPVLDDQNCQVEDLESRDRLSRKQENPTTLTWMGYGFLTSDWGVPSSTIWLLRAARVGASAMVSRQPGLHRRAEPWPGTHNPLGQEEP